MSICQHPIRVVTAPGSQTTLLTAGPCISNEYSSSETTLYHKHDAAVLVHGLETTHAVTIYKHNTVPVVRECLMLTSLFKSLSMSVCGVYQTDLL